MRGVVQGVGFRPFVHRLAQRHGLAGFVFNDAGGVVIEVEGDPGAVARFAAAVASEAPPLARVVEVVASPRAPSGETGFADPPEPASPDGARR